MYAPDIISYTYIFANDVCNFIFLAYLCENSIEVGIAYASAQSSWAHRDNSVNFPDARI